MNTGFDEFVKEFRSFIRRSDRNETYYSCITSEDQFRALVFVFYTNVSPDILMKMRLSDNYNYLFEWIKAYSLISSEYTDEPIRALLLANLKNIDNVVDLF